MDGDRFDTFVRLLTAGRSRRGLIRTVSGGAGGALLVHLGGRGIAARCRDINERCRRDNDCCADAFCQSRVCVCWSPFEVCPGGRCYDLQRSNDNCGQCGRSCPVGKACSGGDCLDCPAGTAACGGTCCEDCFVNRRDTPEEPTDDFDFCCPRGSICRSPRGRRFDSCCYRDEVCRDGECCRACGDVCCAVSEKCNSRGQCRDTGSARHVRYRR